MYRDGRKGDTSENMVQLAENPLCVTNEDIFLNLAFLYDCLFCMTSI